MKLLTKAIEAALQKAPLYSTEKKDIAPVLVKFFTPDSNWTWYVLEAEHESPEIDNCQEDWLFFGLVEGHEKKLGYFRLSELKQIRGGFKLPVERDKFFDGYLVDKLHMTVQREVKQ